VLVLEGKQAAGKSSAMKILAGGSDYFTDDLHNLGGSKEAAEQLQGKWIIELPELAALRRAGVEQLKAFLSRSDDDYRAAYGRVAEKRPRRCVFSGTTNAGQYLDDKTGGRRFWPVPVADELDLVALARDRDQLWAETVRRFDAGEAWHITDAVVLGVASEAQADRVYSDTWHDRIEAHLTKRTIARTVDLMREVLGIEKRDEGRHNYRVGEIVHALGWHSKILVSPSGVRARFLVRRKPIGPVDWTEISAGPPMTARKPL
jgi:predicted P-loop ATPase